MVKICWHRYRLNNKTCYEGRVDGEIWYDFTVYESGNYISLTYTKYAGLDNSDVPVYYKFKDTNDVRAVKKICEQDANSDNASVLLPYMDAEYYELSVSTSKLIADTNEMIKQLKCQNRE